MCVYMSVHGGSEREEKRKREREKQASYIGKELSTKSSIFLGFIFVLALALTSHADLSKLLKLTDSQ